MSKLGSYLKGTRGYVFPPTLKASADLSQANPVSTTLYTVLDTTRNCRIISLRAAIFVNNGTLLELVCTIDGVTVIFKVTNPVAATPYFASLNASEAWDAQILETTDRSTTGRPFLLEGRSIKIEARVTWAAQPNPLEVYCRYAKY